LDSLRNHQRVTGGNPIISEVFGVPVACDNLIPIRKSSYSFRICNWHPADCLHSKNKNASKIIPAVIT
jgi:hypothetical protein